MSFVVYTAIAGDYDYPRKIPESMRCVDFICYCNSQATKRLAEKNGWIVRPIPIVSDDPTRVCRDLKVRPYIYLPEYSASLWVDGTVQITNVAASELVNVLASKTLVATFKHPHSKSVHEEAHECKAAGKDDNNRIDDTLEYLSSQGFPELQPTYETCVMFRFHNEEPVKRAMDTWHEMITNYSRRDQLSLGYSLWKNDLTSSFLIGDIRGASHSFYRGRHRGKGSQDYLSYIDAYSFDNRFVRFHKKILSILSNIRSKLVKVKI